MNTNELIEVHKILNRLSDEIRNEVADIDKLVCDGVAVDEATAAIYDIVIKWLQDNTIEIEWGVRVGEIKRRK